MELFHASVSALLFGATTPQDEGGQKCISRQKIKNAGVGLSAQTVSKTDGHGTKSRRESWANPHWTLTNSSLMPSQSPPGPPCASKHASPGRIYLSSTSLDLTEARRSRAGKFPNHIAYLDSTNVRHLYLHSSHCRRHARHMRPDRFRRCLFRPDSAGGENGGCVRRTS